MAYYINGVPAWQTVRNGTHQRAFTARVLTGKNHLDVGPFASWGEANREGRAIGVVQFIADVYLPVDEELDTTIEVVR